jgi:hypothetical protein
VTNELEAHDIHGHFERVRKAVGAFEMVSRHPDLYLHRTSLALAEVLLSAAADLVEACKPSVSGGES